MLSPLLLLELEMLPALILLLELELFKELLLFLVLLGLHLQLLLVLQPLLQLSSLKGPKQQKTLMLGNKWDNYKPLAYFLVTSPLIPAIGFFWFHIYSQRIFKT